MSRFERSISEVKHTDINKVFTKGSDEYEMAKKLIEDSKGFVLITVKEDEEDMTTQVYQVLTLEHFPMVLKVLKKLPVMLLDALNKQFD